MSTRSLCQMVRFFLLILIIFSASITNVIASVSNWVDMDKYNGGSSGWSSNYFNDLNGNGEHDPTEPFGEDYQNGWVQAPDNSCWLASACNMLSQLGYVSDVEALYADYAQNGIWDYRNNKMLTWDDGGLQEYAIQQWIDTHPAANISMVTHRRDSGVYWQGGMFAWEDWSPRNGVYNYLNEGWEVGIGIWPWLSYGGNHEDSGHALTVQNIYLPAPYGITFTDSDRDADWNSSGDLNTYQDVPNGPSYSGGHDWYSWGIHYYAETGDWPVADVGYVVAIIPEPVTLLLLCLGAVMVRRRK